MQGEYTVDFAFDETVLLKPGYERAAAMRSGGNEVVIVIEDTPQRIVLHADPVAALGQSLESADPTDRIVVFGSFHTVGGVLQKGLPRLGAAHVGPAAGAPTKAA